MVLTMPANFILLQMKSRQESPYVTIPVQDKYLPVLLCFQKLLYYNQTYVKQLIAMFIFP